MLKLDSAALIKSGGRRRPYFAHSSAAVRRPEALARRSRVIRTSLIIASRSTSLQIDRAILALIISDVRRPRDAHHARPIELQQARACAAFERSADCPENFSCNSYICA